MYTLGEFDLKVSIVTSEGYATAANTTYFFMFVVALIAFIIVWFVPKNNRGTN